MKLIIATILCISALSTAFAANRLEVYNLNQRSAAEIIPVLRPVLPAGSAINGNGYQLLVSGDEQTHQLVRQMLEKIDGVPRNLVIHVRFSTPSTHVRRDRGAEVDIRSGDVRVKGGEAPRQGAEVTIVDGDSRARFSDKTITTKNQDDSDYSLRVLEGNTAFIQTGTDIPYGATTVFPGGVVQGGIEYRPTRSGFLVRPRLNGDLVLLDINPKQERESRQGGGRIDVQSIETTVSGRIGEWIQLGGISSSNQRTESGTLYSTRQRRDQSSHVFLKVELVK